MSTPIRKSSEPATPASPATPPAGDDPDAIRTDIERTLADLGTTVEELAGRADVKARTRAKTVELKNRAMDQASDLARVAAGRAKDSTAKAVTGVRRRPAAAGVVAVLATAAGIVVLVRHRRAIKASARRRWWSRQPRFSTSR